MAKNGVFSWRRGPAKIGPAIEQKDSISSTTTESSSQEVHVLAVDDSLIDRKVIEKLLKITSCKVTAVDSGRRALQLLGLEEEKNNIGFEGLKVDLIITDYCMPGMTGFELLKKIKESSAFRQVPVVIMSSENVLARIDRCLEEGAEDFIVKPVKLADVKRLKETMFGDEGINPQEEKTCKRKLHEPTIPPLVVSSSPPLHQPPPSPSSVVGPPPLLSSTPPVDFSRPPTTTTLESPIRRIRLSNCD